MRLIFGLSLLLGVIAAAPASAAQGTARQRAACTDDAYRLCERYVPDQAAVAQCLKANIGSVSSACRAQILAGGKAGKAKKRGRRR
jgi:uncharacterized protein (DUF1684 family)